ncbi:proton-coupled amino acid transporter 1-like [Tribolium castaneum]|uniref:proton-coupled amino acid transporter 1-like n=1 Tax=Tribolium castaneum TaxID=7070 RepID=UPI00046BEBAF|nr:PREDICTED: proton-coupled amino acid transporter 1-like [Tribolium castaneum]|eukprot:XP_008194780.1 PREDICTED: proton-coupled amino acid transporter 1-like [Tribolium castaneum]
MQAKPSTEPSSTPTSTTASEQHRRFASSVPTHEATGTKPPTSYLTTIMHLAKCYVGTGIFAMGEGFKNSGLILGPVLLAFLALLNLNCQHILVKTVIKIADEEVEDVKPTFAETVEYTFEGSSINCFKRNSKALAWMTNIFLCCTELGFCCVYFVFIAEHLVKIAEHNNLMTENHPGNKHIMLLIILPPMWASTFLGNLKLLLPLSIIANILMWAGVIIIVYFTVQNLDASAWTKNAVNSVHRWPLFFGTALYAFEGITFVIPLRNEMKQPEKFLSAFGVLNVGMTFVAFLYILVGLLAYWKYGDNVASSVFLNITADSKLLPDIINAMMAVAVLFTFTLHMYVPFEITFPLFYRKYGPFKHTRLVAIIYRSIPVLLTFTMANVIPFLGLFISLVGASAGAFLALILPPILDLIAFKGQLSVFSIIKDSFIISIGVFGSITGTILSFKDIVEKFQKEYGS